MDATTETSEESRPPPLGPAHRLGTPGRGRRGAPRPGPAGRAPPVPPRPRAGQWDT
ncbi:hypothetical protein [Actinomadura sp. KC345]|uniref:hypothetical protein n=1 Tax=Actinomadura sp. KC345 TaxID=2530371 RepID=UPI0014050FAB|nr:hypothetical protein [Actinomadura sp. KC345]